MNTLLTRDYLSALIEEAQACRITALIKPCTKLIEALGDRPLLELSSWDLVEPLASIGYDVDEYREHIRDWDPSYAPDVETPWGDEDSECLPHPIVVEAAEAGFGAGRVLDIGCGVGANSVMLAQRGASVLGVDVSAQAVARAQALSADSAQVEFRVRNAFDLECLPESFDSILDSWCIHHIPAHLMSTYLQHIAAALRPGGELLLLAHSAKYNPTVGLLALSLGVVGKTLRYILEHNPESCLTRSEVERLLQPLFDISWIRHYYDFHINADRHYSLIVRATKR